ncbi:hypothetical protein POTOM_045511 [Populus tomentosa]|uniref:RNA 2'-phosphotransferase n=1 Tax=Populus tomentosa TaxID=118781 RepID=A0A8X8CD72_POPTO|nr:hypothetical protein POTOM_045511 [Populus tomentosa]
MWAFISSVRILGCCRIYLATSCTFHKRPPPFAFAAFIKNNTNNNMSSSFSHSNRGFLILLTWKRILHHKASELNLNMRSDGFVKVEDLLKLNMKTFANVPLRSHTDDDVKEVGLLILLKLVVTPHNEVLYLLEEGGELLIHANQGHSIKFSLNGFLMHVETVESESLLKAILSPKEITVCVHGTYKKNLDSILEHGLKGMQILHVHFSSGLPTCVEVISGMRWDVNVLIFLDVRKALEGININTSNLFN